VSRTARLLDETLTAALMKYTNLKHFRKLLKSTVTIERLKALKLTKLTVSGRLFQTFITLLEKKFILPLLLLGLYNLYACPLVFDTVENSKKSAQFNFTKQKTIFLKLYL